MNAKEFQQATDVAIGVREVLTQFPDINDAAKKAGFGENGMTVIVNGIAAALNVADENDEMRHDVSVIASGMILCRLLDHQGALPHTGVDAMIADPDRLQETVLRVVRDLKR